MPLTRRLMFRVLVPLFALSASLSGQNAKTANPHGKTGLHCQGCHTTSGWSPLRAVPEFNHNTETGYPLRGMHRNVPCSSCHVQKVFTNVGRQCQDCHADLHRRQFGAACQDCHTVQGWKVNSRALRDHQNRFPLIGAHAAAACESCHRGAASGVYVGLSTECVACHRGEFDHTSAPSHSAAGFPVTCSTCHSMDTWSHATFDHNQFTQFPLHGAHAPLACAACHAGNTFKKIPTDCFSCHAKDFAGAKSPDHIAAGFPRECQTCHTDVSWKGAQFDHNTRTRFPLTGMHANVNCASCHTGGKFAGTPTNCASCHMTAFERATNPNHVASAFPTTCETCHTTAGWRPARFDHSRSRFPLTGKHTTVECSACHSNGKYTGTPTQCSGCHLPDFQKTTSPNHTTAGFPTTCDVCHNTSAWKPASFDHNRTRFPLTGKHTTVACSSCHVGGRYTGTPAQCSGCHLPDFQKTTSPNHITAGFPTTCETCHNTSAWKPASFDHNTQTKFPLTGKHATTDCAACHINGKYAGTPNQCSGCHLPDFQKTTNPNHVAAGFPTTCDTCHNTSAWRPASFDHNRTRFPLTGKHTTTACSSCHIGGKYAGTPLQCSGCHLPDFQKTTNPNHVAAGFPTTCDTCHTTAGWSPASFDHNTRTRFPLTGKHIPVACSSCHLNGKYAGTPTNCSGCHLPDYQKTTNPNHQAAGFPTTCETCHTTSGWSPANFNHNTQTKFPLTGKHTTLACSSCHGSGAYASTPTNCSGCHLPDYQKTTNPNHPAAGFPTTCETCHTTSGWSPANFNHNTQTKFPLTGKHTTLACSACHVNGRYAGTPTLCSGCHLPDFQKTTNPNHVSAGFPTTCDTCHNTTAWQPSSWNHNNTPFPLTGAHTSVPCSSCHINGKFPGTPTDCYSCHSSEYNGTSNPNHRAAAFPTTCQTCHTTSSWSGATFNHTYFPIYSGSHAGKWSTCADCHANSADFSVFNCTTCHAHDKPSTDSKHQGVRGYVYNSANCYSCHPQGTSR